MPRAPRPPSERFWPLLFNALRLRCPVCKQGRIFPGWMRMADACPACAIPLKRESGYFLGSIYFNYGATCALAGLAYFGLLFGIEAPSGVALATAVFLAVAFPFWFWRYARSLWLMMDQYFDPRVPPATTSTSDASR
jgi:uncharacterized protein (DUF983 family)